jgi:hypothetical protein
MPSIFTHIGVWRLPGTSGGERWTLVVLVWFRFGLVPGLTLRTLDLIMGYWCSGWIAEPSAIATHQTNLCGCV